MNLLPWLPFLILHDSTLDMRLRSQDSLVKVPEHTFDPLGSLTEHIHEFDLKSHVFNVNIPMTALKILVTN